MTDMSESQFCSLVEALQARAAATPDAEAVRFLSQDAAQSTRLTVAQLNNRAMEIAAALQDRVHSGDRVVLMLPSGLDYCAAFYGCLYAGIVAVPAYPPEKVRGQHLQRLGSILGDADPALILTNRDAEEAIRTDFVGQPVVAVEDMPPGTAAAWRPMVHAPDAIAFLQYTSGSTSQPKGVCVSHGNLVANERLIRDAFGVDETDVFLSWLPLFHDMGLIGGMLQPIFSGVPCVLMAPQSFLERPGRWLKAISDHGATVSGGPDFSYRLCHERIRPAALEGIDLSRWRLAFTGSEPVRFDTMDGFAKAFAPAGFNPRSVFAGYGLAEATLYVSGGYWRDGAAFRDVDEAALAAGTVVEGEGRRLTNCGESPAGCRLRIVDPATSEHLQAGRVGEIWVAGDSIAPGYWRNPQATAETFVRADGRTWLRTGDLGVLIDEQLYVTGRLKDMIVLRGQNLYPQDLEQAVETRVDAVRKGRVAVFAVDQADREAIGVAAEIARGTQRRVPEGDLLAAIGQAIVDACQEAPALVALLNPGALPKTSSGKLQRAACRQGLEAGSIDCYRLSHPQDAGPGGGEAPMTGTEKRLADLWSALLDVPAPGRQDNFFALGGNSVTAVQAHARLCQALNRSIDLGDLFGASSLAETAALIDAALPVDPADTPAPLEVIPASGQTTGPLSPSQTRMWFQWKLDPSGCAYNVQGVVRLSGPLDRRAMRAAMAGLMDRHRVLRSIFTEIDGRPVQQVRAQASVPIREEDLSGLSADIREREVARLAEAEAIAPFDLSTGPMMRLRYLALGEDRHVLILTVHHCAADGWSMNLLVDDFAALYQAAADRGPANLPEAPIQYIDYARWQRTWLAGDAGTAALDYWKARLGDGQAAIALPTDRRRTQQTTLAGATLTCPLGEALTRSVVALARDLGVTTPTVLLAAFKALLFRYTGAAELQIGTTVANRTRPETERLVGSFVNMLVLRSTPESGLPFAGYVRQLRDIAIDAQKHQDLPFETLVEALHPERQAAANPLFQVVFDHQWRDLGALRRLEGLVVESVEQSQIATQFDLILHTVEQNGQLEAAFTYATDLFDAETIEQLARHWIALLQAVVRDPRQCLGQIPMISTDERQAIVAAWNRDATPRVPAKGCLHDRFAECARRSSVAVAVACGGEAITYETLNRRANRLAWYLREIGVGPDQLVGLAADRSIDLIVGLLGILKAGGAYLPLDPAYPDDRLAYMQADAAISVVVIGSDLSRTIPVEDGVTVVPLTTEAFPDHPEDDPPSVAAPENLAYSIYTSGSTGKPKGVGITHGNVLRLFGAADRHFDFGAEDVWTLFHSYAFDFSVWEIFGALLYGGRLVIVPYYTSRSPADFYALVAQQGVTVLNQTPSAFRDFAREAVSAEGDALALRYVVFGGEALDVGSLTPWFDRFGDERPALINMYGITETTVHVTFKAVTRREAAVGGSPIGEPLADLTWYCLGDDLEPVPAGVVGQLHVGGAGLARGYLKRPGLTAERFIPNPFDASGGARLYRTGDLALRGRDGRVTYLGRSDSQIKIRGFRIEPGEIEEALRRQPELKDAAAVVQCDRHGESQLVAYAAVDAERMRRAQSEEDGAPLRHWAAVFDDTYGEEGAGTGPSFTGWNDSYADAPIPHEDMQEWLETTVERIRGLNPRHILEIGCGVGLLAQYLAPLARSYRGTDLSERAIADLQAWIEGRPGFENTVLSCQDALDVGGLDAGRYDTVILNSVVSYFPSADYLVDVLRALCPLVGPGGRIFVGDVRQLDHHRLFRTSVELERATPELTVAALRARIDRSVAEDAELLLSPGFFHALAAAGLPVSDVKVQLRRGTHDNELTRYRYDAILTVGGESAEADASCPVWCGAEAGLCDLERRLRQERPDRVYLRSIANRRVARDLAAARALDACDPATGIRALKDKLEDRKAEAVDPEQLWRLAESLGYRARLTWAADRSPGHFDAILADPAFGDVADVVPEGTSRWSDYVSAPQVAQRRRALPARLRDRLKAALPAHMVPAQIHIVDAMPLTANGKLDRKALALAHPTGGRSQVAYLPPQTPTERVLAAIWQDVLGVERVGLKDNFFDLGGHSLLATQVVARIERNLQVRTSLRELFEAPDLQALAAQIDTQRDAESRIDQAVSEIEELAESLQRMDGSDFDCLLGRTEGAL